MLTAKGRDVKEYMCLSTDDKPAKAANGSWLVEMDTGKLYAFNETASEWVEISSAGGGGSSDFSTAKLTIVNTAQQTFSWECPWILDDSEFSCSYGDIAVRATSTETFDIILYKGIASIHARKGAAQLSLSGDIEDDGDNYYIATGDCTITVSE